MQLQLPACAAKWTKGIELRDNTVPPTLCTLHIAHGLPSACCCCSLPHELQYSPTFAFGKRRDWNGQ
ncbi:hypothetical protein B0T14DRAFT_501619 [Immersiella caudata]|uniref:Uncharacterized protein n=1 Tax=Immersiella caudata TaxID=314043 RepID=A0AA40CAT4_9PEZI|nr:hypothetical protein B0T14DRAFT_501619 [Immersiella caudata]